MRRDRALKRRSGGWCLPRLVGSPEGSVGIPGALSLNKTRCLYSDFERKQERSAREMITPCPSVAESPTGRPFVRE